MSETGIWRDTRVAVTVAPPRAARGGGRLGVRLWAWLHAQALLRGPAGMPGDVALVEDDRGRLAARRQAPRLP